MNEAQQVIAFLLQSCAAKDQIITDLKKQLETKGITVQQEPVAN